MTEGTCKDRLQVARLDRTQPPPGYRSWTYRGAQVGGVLYESPDGEQIGPLAAAWAHYEREHDPPGMWSGFVGRLPELRMYTPRMGYGLCELPSDGMERLGHEAAKAAARAAAWPWYWRRAALSQRLCDEGPMGVVVTRGRALAHGVDHWPTCLAWSDEQVAEVERWIAEGGELPEVLRG